MEQQYKSNIPSTQIDSQVGIASLQSLNAIEQCRYLLADLYKMRIVQKVASPISYNTKWQIIQKFNIKFTELNVKMIEIYKSISNYANSTKQQKKGSIITSFDVENLKSLWQQYEDILIKGSFRHYQKIAKIYNLPNLIAISINLWNGRQEIKKQKKCCSC